MTIKPNTPAAVIRANLPPSKAETAESPWLARKKESKETRLNSQYHTAILGLTHTSNTALRGHRDRKNHWGLLAQVQQRKIRPRYLQRAKMVVLKKDSKHKGSTHRDMLT